MLIPNLIMKLSEPSFVVLFMFIDAILRLAFTDVYINMPTRFHQEQLKNHRSVST